MLFRQKKSVIFHCLRHPSGQIKVNLWFRTGRDLCLKNTDEVEHVKKKLVLICHNCFSVHLAMHFKISEVGDNKIIHDLILINIYLQTLLCEIKSMIQFSWLWKLVGHRISQHICTDFPGQFPTQQHKIFKYLESISLGFWFVIALYISTEYLNLSLIYF